MDNRYNYSHFIIYKINTIDKTLIDNIVFQYDSKNFPEFTDTLILSADYDGIPMNEEQLDEINQDSDFIHETLFTQLY